jgi:hypothetical protein
MTKRSDFGSTFRFDVCSAHQQFGTLMPVLLENAEIPILD